MNRISKNKRMGNKKKTMSNKKRISNKKKSSRSRHTHKRRNYKRKTVGGFGGVPGCDYLKVEGLNLPGLKIEDQYAAVNQDCTPKPTGQLPDHPNISNQTK